LVSLEDFLVVSLDVDDFFVVDDFLVVVDVLAGDFVGAVVVAVSVLLELQATMSPVTKRTVME
jgi:hypothetical protein